MTETTSANTLRWRVTVAVSVCAAIVTICYFFVDRPVAFFVHNQDLSRFTVLTWLTYLPMALNAIAPVIVFLVAIKLARVPLKRLERTLFAASISLMVALAFEYYLKFLFGRYWPETWIDNNPSLISDGAYGFHPFHFGAAYGSFPSGHTTRAFAVLSVFWIAYPNWRRLWAVLCSSVIIGLVGMNYHFVGDTVAGAFLGAVTGGYTAHFLRVRDNAYNGCNNSDTW